MKKLKLFVLPSLAFSALLLCGCELLQAPQPAPPPIPTEKVEPVKPPQPVERDLSLGPRPSTKPTEVVCKREIPAASSSANAGTTYRSNPTFPETGELQGITQAHTDALHSIGSRGLEWSSSLEQQAKLMLLQSQNACSYQSSRVLSAPGEALYVAPAGLDAQGKDRYANVSVRGFVEKVKGSKAGPFGRLDRGALTIGCAASQCSNKKQIWLCRYK